MGNGQGDRRGTARRRKLRAGLAMGLLIGAMLMVGIVVWLASGVPSVSPRFEAAEIAQREGRYDDAIAAYRQALREDPPNHQARWGLAQAHLARRDFAAAIAAFRVVHAAVPSGRSALALAQALALSGATLEASLVLESWLQVDGADVDARRALADLEFKAGDRAAARAQFERVRKAVPDDGLALARLSLLYDEAGDPRARHFAERAYQRAPGSADARDALGWLLVRAGELQDGRALLEQAHTALPAEPIVGYHYAFALARTGETGRASALLHALLSAAVDCSCRGAARQLLAEIERS